MAPRKIEIAPELVAEGRRLYEQTLTPVPEVAAVMGICRRTLENRISEWNWTRRRTRALPSMIDRAIGTATTQEEAASGIEPAAVTHQQRLAFAQRVQDAVDRHIAAVERVLDKVRPTKPDETERSARTLATISYALRELAAIAHTEPVTPPTNETDNDPIPRDIDDFREELARRIRRFIDARRHGGDGLPDDAAGDVGQ